MSLPEEGWKIHLTPNFIAWLSSLEKSVQNKILEKLKLLKLVGPSLGRPDVDTLENSQYTNMKEFRILYKRNPYRVFFVFDSERKAVVLHGDNKKGQKDSAFYKKAIPVADQVYFEYQQVG